MTTTPRGLKAGGKKLWSGVIGDADALDVAQLAALEGACRMRDRADQLAPLAAGGDASSLRHERESIMAMTRLLAAMRLPDTKTGKRPGAKTIRGVEANHTAKVSTLERVLASAG